MPSKKYMSEEESRTETSSDEEVLEPIDNLLTAIEDVKTKVSDAEYMKLVELLTKVRNSVKYAPLNHNKVVIADLFLLVGKTILNEPDRSLIGRPAPCRGGEAVNMLVSFTNILLNLERMTDDTDPSRNSKLTFLLDQLNGVYAVDEYGSSSKYRSPFQILDFSKALEALELIGQLELT